MNWELIRIGIDVLSVLMAVVMIVVLYIAYKSYKKVSGVIQPLKNVQGLFGGVVDNKETKEDTEKKNDTNSLH